MPRRHRQDAFDNSEQQNFSTGRTSSTSGSSLTSSSARSLLVQFRLHTVGLPTKFGRTHIGLVADALFVHSLTWRSCTDNLFVLLLFERAGRLRFLVLGRYHQVIPSLQCYPDAIRAQGPFFSPPIIRDRAGAIRPDFSVCVESRCTLAGRASTVIACLSCSLLGSGKGVGGLSFGLMGRRSAAISVGVFLTLFVWI